MTISLCMIVKDEADVLARCLDGIAAHVDEIVIADTGSADDTVAIAERYGARVVSFPWRDDFSLARNFSFSQATGDYLLWLDADDVIAPEEAAKLPALRALLEREAYDMVYCPYETGTACFQRERFLKRSAAFRWVGRVHECIVPRGTRTEFGFRVRHLGSGKPRGDRNLRLYRKWAAEEPLSGRDLFYFGRELYYHRLYGEAISVLRAMIGGDGWYVNKIEACRVLAACLRDRGDGEEELLALLGSFRFGEPRAAVLCEIGDYFRRAARFREAIFWYEAALTCRDHTSEGDFENPDARGVTPLLELTVCYYAVGERDKALECHKKTEALAPGHPSVVFNRKFFGE